METNFHYIGGIKMQKLENVMTPSEVAKRLHVSSKTIIRLVQDGSLPALKLKRAIRISESAVDEFIQRNYRESTIKADKKEAWDDEEKPKKERFSLQGIFKGGEPIPEEAIDEAIKEWNKVKELQ